MAVIKALSHGPRHHFFGYYGMSPWDRSGRYHLALETDFHDRRPEPQDQAAVGLLDTSSGEFLQFARTAAFNFQQGAMLHWISVGVGEEFTYNDWQSGRLVCRAVLPCTRAVRTLDSPVEAVSPTEPLALGLNYARMFWCRPVVGYAQAAQPPDFKPCPDDDGLWAVDLKTGNRRLVLSIAQVVRALPAPQTREGPAYFNHVVFNTDGRRALFMCRIKKPDGNFYSSLWTVAPDGSDLACQIDYRHKVSHFDWRDARRLLISTDVLQGKMQFVEFTDGQHDFRPVGAGVLPSDGHATFSPDRRWVACDVPPQGADRLAELMLYNLAAGRKVTLGRFRSPKPFTGDIRCDLHPRWRADGKAVSFDSIHEGTRQVYVADVAEEVAATP
ncbi:MAG: hypothetical protein FJ288_11935 [Planctomycetes bacterium]|nr:hypothetical protein [Planctomycetota bacterium]